MTDHSDLVHHSLAMFVSNSKPNSSSQNQSQSHGSVEEGVETTLIEEEEEVDTIIMEVILLLLKHLRITLLRVIRITIPLRISKLIVHHARFV